ncbi:MAG: GntR family transcriptional regulator [Geminicoccaceae bacterium]
MRFEDATGRQLDPARAIAPQLYRLLRERIIRNELPPGTRISETEIAARYAVSRQPVREAFIKLSGEGLMAIRPQRGTIVTRIDYAAVLDARFLREAIEADIVRVLASDPSPAVVADLRRQVSRQKDTGARFELAFMQLDDAFHRALAEGIGKAGAWKLIEGLKSQMDRVRFLALKQFPVGKLVEQHRALVDRIAAGDAPGAERAIRDHLREVLNDLPDIVRAHPDFFDMPDGDPPRPVNAPIQGGDRQ